MDALDTADRTLPTAESSRRGVLPILAGAFNHARRRVAPRQSAATPHTGESLRAGVAPPEFGGKPGEPEVLSPKIAAVGG